MEADGVPSVYAWGTNVHGDVGIGVEDDDDRILPVEVPSLRGRRVLSLQGMPAQEFSMVLLAPTDTDRS